MVEDNVKVALVYFAALNAHDFERMDAMRSTNFVSDNPAGHLDLMRMRRYSETLVVAFPDLHFDITLTVAEGKYVALNWLASGTHTGMFRTPSKVAIPPTHRRLSLPGSHTFEISGGKISRMWFYTDMASLLMQLGLIPSDPTSIER